jgi:hypothetical protein
MSQELGGASSHLSEDPMGSIPREGTQRARLVFGWAMRQHPLSHSREPKSDPRTTFDQEGRR